jgi:uncharacterized coiled-coil DUF342 family protein
MHPVVLNWGLVAVIMGGYLLGISLQNRGIAALRAEMNNRLGDMNNRLNDMNNRISHLEAEMNTRISDLKDFVHSENRRLEDRIERFERPVLRP